MFGPSALTPRSVTISVSSIRSLAHLPTVFTAGFLELSWENLGDQRVQKPYGEGRTVSSL